MNAGRVQQRTPGADPTALFEVGVIVGTRGLRGELRVKPTSGSSSALLDARTVYLAAGSAEPTAFAVRKASLYKAQVMLQLATIEHIDQVAELNGKPLLMRYADLGELPESTYYWYELEGLAVSDRQHGDLGRIEELLSTAAHDIYVVRGPYGEVLIPAVDAFIVAIDPVGRSMTVDLPDGLIPGTDEV